MRHLLTLLLLAASAFGQTATISDTIRTPFGGTFSGTVTVSLNSPALAQPLYSGNVTLSGWTQAVTVTAGVFALTLYTNDLITPGGTSYTATYAPTSGSGWKETWIVPTGATTIREIRSTTVPSPSVRFTPSQITQAGATLNQVLRWNGATWAPSTVSSGIGSTVQAWDADLDTFAALTKTDDTTIVANGSVWESKTLPACAGTNDKLLYNAATNSFSCGTDQHGGGGGGGGSTSSACEIIIGDPGNATPILADDNDAPAICSNVSGGTQTITEIACYSNAGTPTVNPIITGGSGTSLLSAPLTCGTGSYATGTLSGTPSLANGATIDANIATAGGVAKYIVIRIVRQ